jgi:biopolymer transport protein TolQ
VEVSLRASGVLLLALQDPSASTASSLSIIELVRNASFVVQFVLIVLVVFSAASWAVIVFKSGYLRKAARQNAAFLQVFRKSSRFSEVQASCSGLPLSPLVGLFQSGYAELTAQMRSQADHRPGENPGRPTLRSLEAVDRALLRASTTEIARLEHRIAFLATTASITPYIGLFGTVWGIMTAFFSIAGAGSTSLGVVAPPIAEALIATALGLFAAIPAVYFYNDLTSRVKAFANEMEDFSLEFLTIAERNFT